MKIGILGGSGNVGRCVIGSLLSRGEGPVDQVLMVNRRTLDTDERPSADPRLTQCVVDMSSTHALQEACVRVLRGVDVVISTMGIGSGKGSAEEFSNVEVELPSAFARAAKQAGVRRAVLLTGVGADIESTSSWMVGGAAEGKFFHFKGVVEQRFVEAGFVDGVTIVRPAGLLGTSHMPRLFNCLLPALDWMAPARFRSVHIEKLAHVMASVAIDAAAADTILEGRSLHALVPGVRWSPNLGEAAAAVG